MRYVLFILCINLEEYIITQLYTVSTRSHRIWLVTLCCLCMKSSFCAELWNIYSCQNILLSSDSPRVSFYYRLGKQIQHHLRGLFFSQYPNELSLIKNLQTLTTREPAPVMLSSARDMMISIPPALFYHFAVTIMVKQPKQSIDFTVTRKQNLTSQ